LVWRLDRASIEHTRLIQNLSNKRYGCRCSPAFVLTWQGTSSTYRPIANQPREMTGTEQTM
jgi:hypothetical protein